MKRVPGAPDGALPIAGSTLYVPGLTNSGYVDGLIIDTGPDESVYEFVSADRLAITHGHADHFACGAYLRKRGATVVAARDDAALVENPDINIRGMFSWAKPGDLLVSKLFRGNPLPRRRAGREVARPARETCERCPATPSATPASSPPTRCCSPATRSTSRRSGRAIRCPTRSTPTWSPRRSKSLRDSRLRLAGARPRHARRPRNRREGHRLPPRADRGHRGEHPGDAAQAEDDRGVHRRCLGAARPVGQSRSVLARGHDREGLPGRPARAGTCWSSRWSTTRECGGRPSSSAAVC